MLIESNAINTDNQIDFYKSGNLTSEMTTYKWLSRLAKFLATAMEIWGGWIPENGSVVYRFYY